jgi:exosortase
MMQDNRGAARFDDFRVAGRIEGAAGIGSRRFTCFFVFLFLGICVFALPLKALIAMSLDSEYYSFIPLIFVTSGYLVVSSRKEIFEEPVRAWGYGAVILVLSLIVGLAGLNAQALGLNDYLCVMISSFWLFLTGSFILFFGGRTFKKAIFPLGLLLFVIPFPEFILDKIIDFLQMTSYVLTGLIFNALGFFPVAQGLTFTFPEISIEVARQCSGIRSCMALVILSLLCGHFFLRSNLNRILLVVFAVPIAVFKNGVRIVCLTLGAIYVDPRIMSGELHKKGGYPVFALAFLMLMTVMMVMRKLEKRRGDTP